MVINVCLKAQSAGSKCIAMHMSNVGLFSILDRKDK